MKTKILTFLRTNNDFVSGQELCEKLGVSRTAVWKVINQLKADGYKIEAVKNKGYRLVSSEDVLTESELRSAFLANGQTKQFGASVFSYDVIDSTNNMAKKLAEDGAGHGTLVVAEQQTGGKGRRGRNWVSPPKTGIWMTYVLRPDILPANASMLTIVAAMAVLDGVRNEINRLGTKVDCAIKWPNDIVLNGKKIVGILTEMSAEPDFVNYVVVGIGINVNTTDFPDDIKDVASSVYLETGIHLQRSRVIADITSQFEKYYETFIKTENLCGLVDDYNARLANVGKQVKIIDSRMERVGVAHGINENGELLVTLEDGTKENVISGEVSVRGLYGYV